MKRDRYLQCYLALDKDWPLSLVSITAQQSSPMFTSIQLFDIYSMSDEVFQFHWPMIAGALAEVDTSS